MGFGEVEIDTIVLEEHVGLRFYPNTKYPAALIERLNDRLF